MAAGEKESTDGAQDCKLVFHKRLNPFDDILEGNRIVDTQGLSVVLAEVVVDRLRKAGLAFLAQDADLCLEGVFVQKIVLENGVGGLQEGFIGEVLTLKLPA